MSNGTDKNGQTHSTTLNIKQTNIARKENLKIFLSIGLMIFFDIALPFALYYILKNYMQEIYALLISGIPPFIVSVCGFISKRRADIAGVVIVISFIVSAIPSLLRDDPRTQLLRKSAIVGAIGTMFLITLIPIKFGTFQMRPLSFYFCKDLVSGGSFAHSSSSVNLPGKTKDEPITERWERYWVSYPFFRRGFIIMTAITGFGLLSEVPIRVIIIFRMSADQAFLWTNVINYVCVAIIVVLILIICIWMMKQSKKRVADVNSDAAAADADA